MQPDKEIKEVTNDLVHASGSAAAGVPYGLSLLALPEGSWPLFQAIWVALKRWSREVYRCYGPDCIRLDGALSIDMLMRNAGHIMMLQRTDTVSRHGQDPETHVRAIAMALALNRLGWEILSSAEVQGHHGDSLSLEWGAQRCTRGWWSVG